MSKKYYGSYLDVSVDEVVDLEVLVVLAKRIQERLGNLDPAHVADKFQDGEVGQVQVGGVDSERVLAGEGDADVGKHLDVLLRLRRDQKLAAEQRRKEVGKDRDRRDLSVG